jgi:hypothetical protein
MVHGGQQPVSGATVEVYAVSSTATGAASTLLLSKAVTTDSTGGFGLTGDYTCPSASALVYIVVMGGNPGMSAGTNNKALGLMTAVGPCSTLTPTSYLEVNEVTTVDSVMALSPYMTSYQAIGSTSADATNLAAAFTTANQFVNMATGTIPGPTLPQGTTVPTTTINTLADIVASCVNSAGDTGTGSACHTLFQDTKNSSGVTPTNTLDALLQVANSPTANIANEYGLLTPNPPFSPMLTAAPSTWAALLTTPTPPSGSGGGSGGGTGGGTGGSGTPPPTATGSPFTLTGLISPATVAESIFVEAASVPSGASVGYYVDNGLVNTTTTSPYFMGTTAAGYSVDGLSAGTHTLQAFATLSNGTVEASNTITLNVVKSINSVLSSGLKAYANMPTAQSTSTATLLSEVNNASASLTSAETATRQAVMQMYTNWGINPALDYSSDESGVLAGLEPQGWAAAPAYSASTPISMLFSPDAPYYHTIPAAWPKVVLPSGYIKTVQVNTHDTNGGNGDGIGYGEVVATATSPTLKITSEWYTTASTLVVYSFPMPSNWAASLPGNPAGDSHMIYIDPMNGTFDISYKTTAGANGPDALYAAPPTSLNSLGDHGGSTAASFAEPPLLIQPGEATASTPIPHAVGGPVARTWGARVYPAIARDAGMLTSANSCTGTGYTNTGIVPYGALLQLDPSVNLTTLGLSLPALRILTAMQTYGYYVMDFGCGDMDIYTAVNEAEFEPYGGMYGNANGPGVQNEVTKVIAAHNLYVVAPLTKKQ